MKLGEISREPPEGVALDITPLIDVVFILLIFFVVTTTFVRDLGLDIDRPEASSGRSVAATTIRVAVSDRGEIAVEGRPTSPWRVEAEVHTRVLEDPHANVLLVADRAVEAEALVAVIDACRRGGAQHVALAVDAVLAAEGP